MHEYKVIGLMSGTSLDGLDIAYCKLTHKKKGWKFKIQEAVTVKYTDPWKQKLSTAHTLSGEELMALHAEYGDFLGESCRRFIQSKGIKKIDLISSHGHTIFHQPQRKFTFQLGDGNGIYAKTKVPVVYDFRTLDVTLGGQGAPLVPIGDQYLFDKYDACLNLGGIANISTEANEKRIAFDICFVNMGLNYLAAKNQKEYDKGGALAAKGVVNEKMLSDLEKIYTPLRKKKPSLGREGFEQWLRPILENDKVSVEDRLRTFSESIVNEIEKAIPRSRKQLQILATGGGALNTFLIALLKERFKDKADIVVPERQIIDFKEALVFALLGVLRIRNEVNVLKSVTGAKVDSSSGSVIAS